MKKWLFSVVSLLVIGSISPEGWSGKRRIENEELPQRKEFLSFSSFQNKTLSNKRMIHFPHAASLSDGEFEFLGRTVTHVIKANPPFGRVFYKFLGQLVFQKAQQENPEDINVKNFFLLFHERYEKLAKNDLPLNLSFSIKDRVRHSSKKEENSAVKRNKKLTIEEKEQVFLAKQLSHFSHLEIAKAWGYTARSTVPNAERFVKEQDMTQYFLDLVADLSKKIPEGGFQNAEHLRKFIEDNYHTSPTTLSGVLE